MNERKWTPGPWWINGTKSIRGPEGSYIANANWKNGNHNAHLIAAAPDLYEALCALASYAEETIFIPETVYAALAKARGELK